MMPLEIGLFGALPLCFPFSDDIILAWSLRVYFLSLRLVRLRVVLAGVIKSKSSPSSVSPISACPSELHSQEVRLCPANTQQDQLVTAAGTFSNILNHLDSLYTLFSISMLTCFATYIAKGH